MLTYEQSMRFNGCRRIVRHIHTGEVIGVAVEIAVACGLADRLWLHGDSREWYRFSSASGKVIGMPWRADVASDSEVADLLNSTT